MKSVPNLEVMKHYLSQEGFRQARPNGMFSAYFSKEFGAVTVFLSISEECEESTSHTEDCIRELAERANISERGMTSRIIKSWVNTHLMRPTK